MHKHGGEVHIEDGVQYKVIKKEQDEYIPQDSKKSTNLFVGYSKQVLHCQISGIQSLKI